jgi:hypothetical protein
MASKPPKITVKTNNSPSQCRPVVVEWVDAAVSIGWDEGQADAAIEPVTSLGWLMQSSDDQIILGADISFDSERRPHTNRRIAIPSRWIKSIKEIDV